MLLRLSAFAIGDDLCIVSLPSETFAEYQLFADEASPFKHTVVFGYTNGGVGYIATKKDYDLRCAWWVRGLNQLPLAPRTFDRGANSGRHYTTLQRVAIELSVKFGRSVICQHNRYMDYFC